MSSKESFIDQLAPDAYKLVLNKETGVYETTIVDVDLDQFECILMNDDTIEINTSGCEWITLSSDHIAKISTLLRRAAKKYELEDFQDLEG